MALGFYLKNMADFQSWKSSMQEMKLKYKANFMMTIFNEEPKNIDLDMGLYESGDEFEDILLKREVSSSSSSS